MTGILNRSAASDRDFPQVPAGLVNPAPEALQSAIFSDLDRIATRRDLEALDALVRGSGSRVVVGAPVAGAEVVVEGVA